MVKNNNFLLLLTLKWKIVLVWSIEIIVWKLPSNNHKRCMYVCKNVSIVLLVSVVWFTFVKHIVQGRFTNWNINRVCDRVTLRNSLSPLIKHVISKSVYYFKWKICELEIFSALTSLTCWVTILFLLLLSDPNIIVGQMTKYFFLEELKLSYLILKIHNWNTHLK